MMPMIYLDGIQIDEMISVIARIITNRDPGLLATSPNAKFFTTSVFPNVPIRIFKDRSYIYTL